MDFGSWIERNRARAEAKMKEPTFYFHGGRPGLEPGDLLLPPSQTGATNHLVGYRDVSEGERASDTRLDLVFCTVNPFMATRFAATYPGGALYMVDPHLPMEPDPYVPAISLAVSCPAATVIAVLEPCVPLTSQPLIVAETLEAQADGTMNALHRRALEAMRVTGLLERGLTPGQWKVQRRESPTRADVVRSVQRAVGRLTAEERDRYSNPERRVPYQPLPAA